MINIIVARNARGIESVEIKGHSGYAKSGKDIVCSAVSAITQTALLGIINVSDENVDYVLNEQTGYLKFSVPKNVGEVEDLKIQTILETMLIGLKDLEKGYNAFIKLEVK